MKLIIHDLPAEEFAGIFSAGSEESIVCGDDGTMHPCIGCFACWVKTPGICVMKDSFSDLSEKMKECTEIVIISRCVFGGFSPFIKAVADRTMPFLQPVIELKNNETGFRTRSQMQYALDVHFYGPADESSKKTAVAYVNTVAKEWNVSELTVSFHDTPEEIGGDAE